jgi:RHS repeat-associated protein
LYLHSGSDLNLALYRAYDDNLARWLSRDPLGERGGLNQYAYAANDPINRWDPFGLEADLIKFGIDAENATRATKLISKPGEFTVISHGTPKGPYLETTPHNGPDIDVEELAREIRLSDKFQANQTIRLLSCNTGKGDFPQKLADLLGTPVIAPQAFVGLRDNGTYSLYKDIGLKTKVPNPDKLWKVFTPKTSGRPAAKDVNLGPKADVPISLP